MSKHAKTNGIDADTLARIPLFHPAGVRRSSWPGPKRPRWIVGCAPRDRLTRDIAERKTRIKALVRQLMPMSPLTGKITNADLAVLERWADPNLLVKVGAKRLAALIAKASNNHTGVERARGVARRRRTPPSTSTPATLPVAFSDLAAEVATEVRLVRVTQTELAVHAAERETAYRWVDPGALARSLPGLADIGGPALVATMGDPTRFAKGKQFRSFTGLVPKASETGDTDRKGQTMSKAGSSLLRTTLVRAADTARKQDPQLARIYYVQMVERGKNHLGALCVVAANLAERAWTVMNRRMPYVICDTDGTPVTAERSRRDHRRTLDRAHRRSRSTPQQEGEGPPSHLNETTTTGRPPPRRIVNRSRPRRQHRHSPPTTDRLTPDPA